MLDLNAFWLVGVLEQSGVKRMVDLGCGEGKLLEHLIRSQDCPSLKQMVNYLCCITHCSDQNYARCNAALIHKSANMEEQ